MFLFLHYFISFVHLHNKNTELKKGMDSLLNGLSKIVNMINIMREKKINVSCIILLLIYMSLF